MKIDEIRKNAYGMPYMSPAFSKGPYQMFNREFFIISYRTDPEAFRKALPEPLTFKDPIVNYEFIRMPDCSGGFGDYTESGQIMSIVDQDGNAGGYSNYLYLNGASPTLGGRELWGFPKKIAEPKLRVESDALVGTLDYGSIRVATGTMGYKYSPMDTDVEAKKLMTTPNYLLKIIPNPDLTPGICQLVRYFAEDVHVEQAWTGPAQLELFKHALAPIADLPVLEVVGAKHLICSRYTIGLGEVVVDYLK